MRPVRFYEHVGTEVVETDDLPRVIDPKMITTLENTVLDPVVTREGRWLDVEQPLVDYCGRATKSIWIPPIGPMVEQGLWIVHPVMWMANQVIRVHDQVRRRETPPSALQKMFSGYQSVAEKALVGKSGLLRQVIIGTRMKRSGRAVLVPNGSHHPAEVGLPGRFFEDMGIEHHDLVMIGRNPTIWSGSIEIVKARRSPDDVVELHPLLFYQLGGDCDGDDVYFSPVPKDPECQEEARQELIGFCLRHGHWQKQGQANDSNPAVDWENVKSETKRRFRVTGFSVGPEDIIGETENVARVEEVTGKDLQGPCRGIAERLDWNSVRSIISDKNHETLRMKKHLGLVGLASNRIKILAGRVPAWVSSADYLSERLQQTLLDAKHLDGAYSVFDILSILERRGDWRKASPRKILEGLVQTGGLDQTACRPIVLAIYVAYPWMVALDEMLPVSVERGPLHAILRKMGSKIDTSRIIGTLEKKLTKLGYGERLDQFKKLSRYHSGGLTSIASRFYPLHEAIAGRNPNRGLSRRLFHYNDIDPTGPCREAWEIWHEIESIA